VTGRLLARSTIVLTLLFGMLFAVLWAAGTMAGWSISAIAVIGVALVAVQYLVGPWILEHLFRIRWVNLADELPHLDQAARRICQERGIPYPRFGVIEDGNPNAFTFGHYPGNARLVFTRGLVQMLDQKEREAVLAHELGHVKHWDVVVMTLASLVPVVLYILGRVLLELSRGRGSRNQITAVAHSVGVVALVLYFVSQYIVLFLSRTRELYADDFSAEATTDPDALSSALVKIAYGLASVTAETGPVARRAAAARMLGIFDPSTAAGMARAVSGEKPGTETHPGRTFTEGDMLRAMRWDLWNPWAKVYQLASTHPLPAVRIAALRDKATELGKVSRFRLPEPRSQSYWDEFLADVFTARLLLLGVVTGGIAYAWAGDSFSTLARAGLWVSVVGAAFVWKVAREYRSPSTAWQVRGLVQEVEVSRVRGIPARLQGRVIGRGVPGLFYSPDLVLDDGTGFITMQYRQPVPGWGFLFGTFKVDRIIGQEGTAEGWFRRAPSPYFEVRKFVYGNGEVKTYWYPAKRILAALTLAAGLAVMTIGLLATG
jgi:Zn-dependent protease with chaperone function